jgi:hypothetical protein
MPGLPMLLKVLVPILTSYLKAFASQVVFEYVLDQLIEAGVKSTKTEWDDKLLERIREERKRQAK